MSYGDFKELTRRTDSDKILRDKPFNIAKKTMDINDIIDINEYLLQWSIIFLIKKLLVVALKMRICQRKI